MAFLIPDNLRRRPDVAPGVARLARALEDSLDDGATVWYEPLFDGSGERPDLVVLVPDVGVLMLEVLQAKAGAVVGARDGKLALRRNGEEILVEDPLARAHAFAGKLEAMLAADTALDVEERLPVAAAGAFPYLSRADAAARRLDAAVALDRCLFRDELDATLGDRAAFRRIVVGFMDRGLRDPLSADAEKRHRALIHPDTVIGSRQLPFPTASAGDEIKVLDREQEALAKTLGAGHRVIRGVAGSGKTLVLTYRARLLAETFPRHRVLVTCFNRSLAGSLRRQLQMKNVTVKTVDQLISDARSSAGLTSYDFHREVPELADRAGATLQLIDDGSATLPRYDHVLIDEAQDFPTAALQFVLRMLRPGSDSLLVVADAAQNIYRNKFTWRAAGIQATGRTRVLDQSYRNTREILEYAHTFLLHGDDFELDGDGSAEDETVIIPPKASDRSGPLPLLIRTDTPQQELLEIARRCRALLDAGTTPGQIGVLYGSGRAGGFSWPTELLKLFAAEGLPVFWVTDPSQGRNKDEAGADDSKIALSTIHSAKGLEFRHVFLCGYLDDSPPMQERMNRRLIYVGMTRASHELVLTASGNHPYIADLET